MATHSRILPWRIPWTDEPGQLQSIGSQRVGHDWAHSAHGALAITSTRIQSCTATAANLQYSLIEFGWRVEMRHSALGKTRNRQVFGFITLLLKFKTFFPCCFNIFCRPNNILLNMSDFSIFSGLGFQGGRPTVFFGLLHYWYSPNPHHLFCQRSLHFKFRILLLKRFEKLVGSIIHISCDSSTL